MKGENGSAKKFPYWVLRSWFSGLRVVAFVLCTSVFGLRTQAEPCCFRTLRSVLHPLSSVFNHTTGALGDYALPSSVLCLPFTSHPLKPSPSHTERTRRARRSRPTVFLPSSVLRSLPIIHPTTRSASMHTSQPPIGYRPSSFARTASFSESSSSERTHASRASAVRPCASYTSPR